MQFIVICALIALFVAPSLNVVLPAMVTNVAGIILVIGIALVANKTANKVKGGNMRETGAELGAFARDLKSAAAEIQKGMKESTEAPKSNTKNKA